MIAQQVDATLERLQGALGALPFALPGPERDERRQRRDRLVRAVAGHRVRLAHLPDPLLVVVAGVTGAGKSTIVNTLVGREVAATGVVRPTTSAPTLVAGADDLRTIAGSGILGELPREEPPVGQPAGSNTGRVLQLVTVDTLPSGLALLDAPDVDSVVDANRGLAEELLDASDVWLWCTSAGKYADETSMSYLRLARDRRASAAVALTRIQPADRDAVLGDLRHKLATQSIVPERIFVVPHARVDGGRVPERLLEELHAWLEVLATPVGRRAHRLYTLRGALAALPGEVARVADDAAEELAVTRAMRQSAEDAYVAAGAEFAAALDDGLPLRAQVLGRWNTYVSTRLQRFTERTGGQARQWLTDLLGRREPTDAGAEVRSEVADTLQRQVLELCDLAAARTSAAWERRPAGRELLEALPALRRCSSDLGAVAAATALGWQEHVAELVETVGADRRVRARWVSTAVNAVATGAIVVALASTGGLTGVEAGIATAAGAANQALLTRLLGAQNVRWLVDQARRDLETRFGRIAAAEQQRFTEALGALAPAQGAIDEVREASDAVRDAAAELEPS